ncbi:MAG TPA: M23 family metallopeptidase [Acidimicrobiia bacterium]|nr:M23 family metallopeptidase [Acidimicrobiia bacterium]
MAGTAGALAIGPLAATRADADEDLVLHFPHNPTVTHFSSSFGAPRSGGRRHQGNDLMAPKGTPVFAATSGVVTIVADGPLSGRYLVVEHSSRWSTWYMHLNNDLPGTDNGRADWTHTLAAGIELGASVEVGQPLAFVGDSGNAEGSGSHTHFELHRDGRAINPFPYLVAAFDQAIIDFRAAAVAAQIDGLCAPGPDVPAIDAEICPRPVGPLSESLSGAPVFD